MRVIHLLTPVLFFFLQAAEGQATWQQGFFINKFQDTTRGWIKYNKNWRFLPEELAFSRDSMHVRPVYLNLNGFTYIEITGEDAFQRVLLDNDGRPLNLWPPDVNPGNQGSATPTGWARVIADGLPYRLYSYEDRTNPELLCIYSGKAHLIVLLDENQQPDDGAGHNPAHSWKLRKSGRIYQAQLEELALQSKADASTVEKIRQTGYQRDEVKEVILALNKAAGRSSFVRKASNEKILLLLGGGIAYCQGQFETYLTDMPQYYFQPSFNACFSFGADFTRAHWTSRNELGYCPYTFRGYATTTTRGAGGHFTTRLHNVNFTSSILYAADHDKKFRPYGGVGLIISLTAANKVDFEDAPSYLDVPEFNQVKMLWALTYKLGMSFHNRFDCCFSYTPRETFPLVDKVKLRTGIFSLWLGLAIRKTH